MRSWFRAALALTFVIGLSGPGRAAADLSTMRPSEIEALQKRLTDDGCYTGAIDGQASVATAESVKACPDQEPVLRIETGMHTAIFGQFGVDSTCHLLATGSLDKTVRLWSLPEGTLVQTIRPPIGPGRGGGVAAVALSRDGRLVAFGGFDAAYAKGKGMGLYLTDRASGTTRRLGNFEKVILSVAFSPDGTRIAVGLAGTVGVRVLDPATGRELLADRDFGDSTFGLAFAGDGSLYTASFDGFIRRYSADLRLTGKVKAPDGQHPYSIAVDPAGHRLAVGYEDTANVSILDAASLKPLAKAQAADLTNGALSSVSWAADGQRLIAGDMAQGQFNGQLHLFLRSFTPIGQRVGSDVPVSESTVMGVMPCGRDMVFGTADPQFGLVRPGGQVTVLQGPVTADMRDKLGTALTVSSDAMMVRFGLGYGEAQPVLFDLGAGTLTEAPQVPAGLSPAKVDGLPIDNWEDKTDPAFQGKPIVLDHYETSRSLAIRSDSTGFVLGADWSVRSFDAGGRERWTKPAPGVTWGANLAGSGRIVVAAQTDGTIRWYRWSDGQELLALFVHAPSKRWVAWTPSGYYMASPGAEDLIGWNVNRGWNQQADFFPASRFRDKFNRPDVVRLALTTLDESEALKRANEAANKHDDTQPLIERQPPVITILSPSEGSTVAPGVVQIRYRVRMPSGGTVDRVEAFIDGVKIEARGVGPSAGATSPSPKDGTVLTLPMPAHDATISLVAYADGKTSDAARVTLKGVVPVDPIVEDDALKPSLYALLIGVTHYDDKSFDLGYAAEDARAFAQALKSQEGRLYRHVEVKVLTDKDATVPGVREGLVWLSRQTTDHDLAIVFEAGHGLQDKKGRFFFGTRETDPTRLFATAFSNDEMEEALAGLPGKKMLFMDACHAGAALDGQRDAERVDMSEAINDFAQAESGMVVYGASTGREVSFENEQWGHGAFTKALLEGIGEGKADLSHKGTITTASLDFFLAERVKELTNGRQHPVMTRPKTVPDFPIATVQ